MMLQSQKKPQITADFNESNLNSRFTTEIVLKEVTTLDGKRHDELIWGESLYKLSPRFDRRRT
jgi:hypothetical protein